MGTKYTSQSTSGYNASPPVDDGTQTEANKVKWSTIKTKLADVLKTFGEAINTQLVTTLDTSPRSVSASDSAAASDHWKTIQVTTSSVTITLADATTMAAGYIVEVSNQSTGNITVALATATDTIDGVTNTTQTISAKETRKYIVNSAATGYIAATLQRGYQLISRTVYTTGSGTHTYNARTRARRAILVGGGGGGGGCDGQGASSVGAGGSGGAGGYVDHFTSTIANEAYAVGAAGAAGAAAAGNGGNGGDTTLGASLTAGGGAGGTGATAGSASAVTGGAGGAATGGDINIAGQPGQDTRWHTTNIQTSGRGGSTTLGFGGAIGDSSVGAAGTGYGAGGGGGCAIDETTNYAGGAGTAGIIIIEEFA